MSQPLKRLFYNALEKCPVVNQQDNHIGTDKPLNDLAVSNLLCNIDNRLLEVAIKTSDMRTRPQETILQCKGILRDCYRLLTQAEPTYTTVDTLAVRGKKANALKYMAHAYSSQGDAEQAKFFFQRAADIFMEIDKKREADRCLADIAWLQCNHEGSVDAAIESLHTILETIAENTLEHAQYLLDLGQMYCAADEDHEAEQILLRAEKELNQLGRPNPTGTQLANALIQTMMTIFSDQQADRGTRIKEKAMDVMVGNTDADKSPILTQNLLRNLYRRLYFMLEKIYLMKGDVNQADKYIELLEQMDGTINEGNKTNLEFSEQMLAQSRVSA